MSNTLSRVGTASSYATAINTLNTRQSSLSQLQQNLTSGKRVLRASDDPTSAAQAERATTRIARIASDQRALMAQRDTVAQAESTLGNATDALQSFRQLVVNAGNGTINASDRASIAQQLTTLRDQIFSYSNQQDSNGVPLFSGLGSIDAPFTNGTPVQFNGLGGQRSGGDAGVSPSIDGQAAFMSVPTGNGTFSVATAGTNTGSISSDAGQVTNPGAVLSHGYSIAFAVNAATGAATYTVTDTTTNAAPATGTASGTYQSGQALSFDGISLTPKGIPANGDTLQVTPSSTSDLFAVMDQTIANIKNAPAGTGALTTGLAQSLSQIDAGMARVQAARGFAGDMLNRADRISDSNTAKSTQAEGERSSAEDLDMIKGLSDFQNQQTGYSAALQSYAQIQKLSLFNFIS
jgi:flagellar hook-associated protein 3 FlgL